MSRACLPPTQPMTTETEQQHPRFAEYQRYRNALNNQLVTASPFALWLEQTEKADVIESAWVGGQKVIKAFGRMFKDTEKARDAAVQIQWANRILSQTSVTFLNGRDSHVVAGEALDKAEETLIDYQLFSA